MQTTLTLGKIWDTYSFMFPDQASLTDAVNRSIERYVRSDIWEDTAEQLDFPSSSDNYLVLPRPFISLLGYTRREVALPVFGQFHEYQEAGLGIINPSTTWMDRAIDAGQWCSQKQISGTCILRVKLTNVTDGGKIVRFYGKDQDGNRIFTDGEDGIPFTMGYSSADTTQQFSSLSKIVLTEPMVGRWTLWQVINGTETQIGAYEPGEDAPSYRAYKIGARATDGHDTIRAFCRRDFLPVQALTDLVRPPNLAAIRYGLAAVRYEDSSKFQLAEDSFQRGEQLLKNEIAAMRGAEIPTLRFTGMALPRQDVTVN